MSPASGNQAAQDTSKPAIAAGGTRASTAGHRTARAARHSDAATAPVGAGPIVFSIDLDEWFHGRWATGHERALWSDTTACIREVYRADSPPGDIIPAAEWVLEALARHQVRATFFVLGQIAQWYPDLVRRVAAAGHEVACHGMFHLDMTAYHAQGFAAALATSRDILEQLTGARVWGYRAPNFVVQPYLAEVLSGQGFGYDSSVCPARGFRGKYHGMRHSPQCPYRIGRSVQVPGAGPLWELPVPTFPWLGVPACTGIATRLLGTWWSRLALWHWGRQGRATQYYFHPYEVWTDPVPDQGGWYVRLFLSGRGARMQGRVQRLLATYARRAVTAVDLVARLEQAAALGAEEGMARA